MRIMGKYIKKIAYYKKRRDDMANRKLAFDLARTKNMDGVHEIAMHLQDKNQSIRSDCIKVLYEVGYTKPELLKPYTKLFIQLLEDKNNRMVWGGMIALSCVAKVDPVAVYQAKELILEKTETGTVITNVSGVWTLIKLAAANDAFYEDLIPDLFYFQESCRPEDYAKRAEVMSEIVRPYDLEQYIEILEAGRINLTSSGTIRLDKVILKCKRRLEDDISNRIAE